MKLIKPRDTTDATLISSSILEDDYPQWSVFSTYSRGDFVISGRTHTVYRSLTDGNTNDPDLEQVALADPLIDDPDPVRWQVIGATNRWRMFDKKPSLQAAAADQIQVILEPGRIIGGMAGFNIDANTVTLDVQSPGLARRNLLVETDELSTQTVAVDAVEHTLSFTGTGTITLSGASTSGPLVGTGERVSLVFTPTAGSLTVTVTGAVSAAQLEEGPLTAYQAVDGSLRRNLLTWSQDIANAAWTKSNVDIVSGVAVAPDGTMTAQRIVPNGLVTTKFISRTLTGIPANTYVTVTFFGQAELYRNLRLRAPTSLGWASEYSATFECLDDGEILNLSSITQQPQPTIVRRNDGWYRCSWTMRTSASAGDRTFEIYVASNSGGFTYFGDGVNGALIGGVQAEVGPGTAYQRIDSDSTLLFDQSVFSRTIPMQDETVVLDWYSYYFTPITPLTEFVVTDFPLYGDAQITATFDRAGATVRVGQIVLGDLRTLGITTIPNTGFTGLDFSIAQQDEFGDLTTVRRAATRLSQFEVLVPNSTLLGFDSLMQSLRGGVAAVWVGSIDARKAATNYGFYRDYRTVYQTSDYSIISLQIQGIV